MASTVITIDINAYLENLFCHVDSHNLIISFDNMGDGVITALKFKATGYNAFGDIVPVNGNEQFFILFQDLNIEKNARSVQLGKALDYHEIQKVDLEEYQICYKNGIIKTYQGKSELTIETETLAGRFNAETVSALQYALSDKIKYLPQNTEKGWLCACGRFNLPAAVNCSRCKIDKDTAFQLNNDTFIEKVRLEYKEHIAQIKRMEQLELKQKTRKATIKTWGIAIGLVLTVMLVIIFVNIGSKLNRTSFSSEEEMRNQLQGTYTYYDPQTGKASKGIVITDDTLLYKYKYVPSIETEITKWNYEDGTFETFETLTVTKDGNIKVDDELYEKGGYLAPYSSYTSSNTSTYESAYTALKITVDSVTSNSSYDVCTGSVKNNGTKTYKFIEVKGAFKDADGNVVDTDWTYAVGSEGLAPGESSTFRLSVTKSYIIKSCQVTLLDYSE